MKDDPNQNLEPNLETWIEPELEARIVALVLGEASDFEREELERLIAEKPELALFRDRIASTHELLSEVASGKGEAAEWKLSAERRKTVLDVVSTTPPMKQPDAPVAISKQKSGKPWVRWVSLAAAACFIGLLTLSVFLPTGHPIMKQARSMDVATNAESMPEFERDSSSLSRQPTDLGATSSSIYSFAGEAEKSAIQLAENEPAPIEMAKNTVPARSSLESLRQTMSESVIVDASSPTSGIAQGTRLFEKSSRDGIHSSGTVDAFGSSGEEIDAVADGSINVGGRIAGISKSGSKANASSSDRNADDELHGGASLSLDWDSDETVDGAFLNGAKADHSRKLLRDERSSREMPAQDSFADLGQSDLNSLAARPTTPSSRVAKPRPSAAPAAPTPAPRFEEETEADVAMPAPVTASPKPTFGFRGGNGGGIGGGAAPDEPFAEMPVAQGDQTLEMKKDGDPFGMVPQEPQPHAVERQSPDGASAFRRLAERDNAPQSESKPAPGHGQVANFKERSLGLGNAIPEQPGNAQGPAIQNRGSIRALGNESGGHIVVEERMKRESILKKQSPPAAKQAKAKKMPQRQSDKLAMEGMDRAKDEFSRKEPSLEDTETADGKSLSLDTNIPLSMIKLSEAKSPPQKVTFPEETAAKNPFSTFSLHVSDVSFKLAQEALAKGTWPDRERIRVEEFVNAFDYGDPMPSQAEKVAANQEQAIHPFLQQRNLLRIAMRTAAAGRAGQTPLRLTILLDKSGSMERPDRVATVDRAFTQLVGQLFPSDQVTLLSFARQPRLLADQASGAELTQLANLAEQTPTEGGTNLEAALQLAFEKAEQQKLIGAQNRIVLITDGAANLGDADPAQLSRMIETIRDRGIAFDAAGVGAEGLNDEILEALTRKGDGRYYLLSRPEDAEDGFAKQIAGALRPAAKNVKIQVEFNPERVGRYKLIGFEKHRLKKEDFRNDKVDAAEMAAEEAGVALYQIEPLPNGSGDIGSVSIRFRDMESGNMIERRWPIPYEPTAARLDQATSSMKLATCAALLGSKLKDDELGQTVDLGQLARYAGSLQGERAGQLLQMIQQARDLTNE
tara:strand:+ start:3727 stop:6960 length:3234 start_codon:yes stop_codon:yes gene_type:complete